MIEFKNVSKKYGDFTALDDISFKVESGELVVIIGPSGCGKTTTLKMINRLIDPDSGSIFIDKEDISIMDKVQLRRSIGYVIQEIGLFPHMTVAQNIAVVPRLLKYGKEKTGQIVREMLEMAGMPYELYAHKYPSQLSGGQQQRVGVLRALAASPPIVLMDEPFGALDPMVRAVLQQEVCSVQKKLKKTVLFVTHDMNEAVRIADKIIFMDKGRIVQVAKPQELLENPANDLVRSFMNQPNQSTVSCRQTAAYLMQSKVLSVTPCKTVAEALRLMLHEGEELAVIKEVCGTYMGTLSHKAAMNAGSVKIVRELANKENAVCYIDEDAQICFNKLPKEKEGCVVVLNRDNTVAGIVTQASAAKALADTVWSKS